PDLVDRGLEMVAAPGRCRDQARAFGADVDSRRAPEPQAACPLLEGGVLPRVEAKSDVVEVRVARGGERGRQVHRLVDVWVPVLEDLLVDDALARALDQLVRAEHALLEGREGRHRLEGRARRIEAGRRSVE